MKVAASDVLRWGMILLLSAAGLFWFTARVVDMRGGSQNWVDSAPNEAARNERAKIRAWKLNEVADLRKQSYEYSLASLSAAAILALLYLRSRISNKKASSPEMGKRQQKGVRNV